MTDRWENVFVIPIVKQRFNREVVEFALATKRFVPVAFCVARCAHDK